MLRFFIVFLLGALSMTAQDPDTLLYQILEIENDTLRANQLYTRGFDLVDKNPQLAYAYAQNCEKAAQKSRSKSHISKSKNLLGILFYAHGHYKRAVVYFEDYLTGCLNLNNTIGIAFGYMNLGNAYMQLKDFDKVELFYLKAINYYNILNDKKQLADGLSNLGVLKQLQKQWDAALENYQKAFEIGKELNDYTIKSNCLNNMGEIFFHKGDYEKALAYNYDALELRELMGLDVDISDSYLSIAEIALKQKNTALAGENLDLAIQVCDKIGYIQGKLNYYRLFSELQEQKNNYQSAIMNFKLYTQLKDSILLTEGRDLKYDFKEAGEQKYNHAQNSIKNRWLLVFVSLLLIIIPFILIRYKR